MTAPTSASEQYAAALVAAGALQSAAGDPSEVIRRMAEQVIAMRETLGDRAVESIAQLWAFTDAYDGDSVQRFTEKAAQVLTAAQTNVARLTVAAQSQQLSAQGIRVGALVPSDPQDVRAARVTIVDGRAELERVSSDVSYKSGNVRVSVQDMTNESVLNRPARAYRYERSQGASISAANSTAAVRVRTIVEDNLMLTQRIAEAEALAQAADLDDRVRGYRRVVHPELARGGSCGMCLVASDRIYTIRELKAIHGGCNCTVAAITDDFDPQSINEDDLTKFYGDAGGNTRRHLKRTRYQVDEHGELGPVLIPKSDYKPRVPDLPARRRKKAEPIVEPSESASRRAAQEKTVDRLLAELEFNRLTRGR